MCGRYALHGPKSRRREPAWADALDDFEPRFNVAPSDTMPIVRLADGAARVVAARWGLVPYWAKDSKIAFKTINARAETVATKPAFRDAYRHRRCLVPASGYYEWHAGPRGKQPYYFTTDDGALLTFAGLWDVWRSTAGETLTSYTIIVGAAGASGPHAQNRLPVIVEERDRQRWLAGPDVDRLLDPLPASRLARHAVSPRVNTTRNDDPSLVCPLPEPELADRAGLGQP